MPVKRPNFLVFITDQQRFDHLGLMGTTPVETPNIDALAAAGVRFDSCYTSCPACMPARQTLFTGRTNRAQGVRQNGNPLPRDIPTLPGLLREAGYRTHGSGKLHLRQAGGIPPAWDVSGEDPALEPDRAAHWQAGRLRKAPAGYYGLERWDSTVGHGSSDMQGDYRVWLETHHPEAVAGLGHFNEYSGDRYPWSEATLPPELHYNHWIADRTIDFLGEAAEGDAPFFSWCSFPDPHSPFIGLRDYAAYYRQKDFELPAHDEAVRAEDLPDTVVRLFGGVEGFRAKRHRFGGEANLRELYVQTFAMIHHIDEQVGRVMAALRENGQDRDTVVVFMSDHGEMLGEHALMHKNYWPYDGCNRVPFIVRPPECPDAGRVVRTPVGFIDFAPTVLDWAGVPQPEDPGVTPEYLEKVGALQPPLPGESLRAVVEDGASPQRGAALVEFDDDLNPNVDCVQMRMLVTDAFKLCYYRPTGECLLYDRRNDPGETENVYGKNGYEAIGADLMRRLLDETMRTEPRLPRRLSGA